MSDGSFVRQKSNTLVNAPMQKPLRRLNDLIAQLRGNGHPETAQDTHRLLRRPTRSDIVDGYRMILGREPESEAQIEIQVQHASVASFRRSLLRSEEFHGQYRALYSEQALHPYWSRNRDTVVFIHLQKTGGTTLRSAIESHFAPERICPMRFRLHSLAVAELGQYDFFAGHFDLDSLRFIPRDRLVSFSLFREPRARLISYYRFHKSHPAGGEYANNAFASLANELSAEEFFEHPEVRLSPDVYNNYLLAFGRSFEWYVENRYSLPKKDLSLAMIEAKRQICALHAIGITERFDDSVDVICHAMSIARPPKIVATNVTDEFATRDPRFRRVSQVHMTPRLAAALEELTFYDTELYQFAVNEFDRRLAAIRCPTN